MKNNTEDSYNNGPSSRNQGGAGESRPQPIPGGDSLVCATPNATGLGAGDKQAERPRARESADADGRSSFEAELAFQQAEGEYQAFLSEVEAEWELSDRQEASAYLGAVHAYNAALAGMGVVE